MLKDQLKRSRLLTGQNGQQYQEIPRLQSSDEIPKYLRSISYHLNYTLKINLTKLKKLYQMAVTNKRKKKQ